MKELFLLISGVSAILTSSLQCSAKDCESCSFQTGCLWQSMTMSCMEAASCAPVGACVDRVSFCSPRAQLAKALQEGRVETQIFSAFDHSSDKTPRSNSQSSFACQLDECSTSLEPKNICKVVAGVNLEVRQTTDPKSESTMYTKYMYVCICGAEWDSGPNHRYCRRRVPAGVSALGPYPDPGLGGGGGYNVYGDRYGYGSPYDPVYGRPLDYGYGYGKSSDYGPYSVPPPGSLPLVPSPVPLPGAPSLLPPPPLPPSLFPLPLPSKNLFPSTIKSLPPSKSTKQPRLIQFEYDDLFVPNNQQDNITANNVYVLNNSTADTLPPSPINRERAYFPSPPPSFRDTSFSPLSDSSSPPSPPPSSSSSSFSVSINDPPSPRPVPSFEGMYTIDSTSSPTVAFIPLDYDSSASPSPSAPPIYLVSDDDNDDNSTNYYSSASPSSSVSPSPSASFDYPIIIPGEDPYTGDGEYSLTDGGYSVVPGEGMTPNPRPTTVIDSNRSTLASLIPIVEEEYIEEDDGSGYIVTGTRLLKKNTTSYKAKKNSTSKSYRDGKDRDGGRDSGRSDNRTDGGKGGPPGKGGPMGRPPRNETILHIDRPEDIIPRAPTSSPPTAPTDHIEPLTQPQSNFPPYYSLQSSDQMRLKFLEILVYSLSGALGLILICGTSYYCCRKRRKSSLSSKTKKASSDTHRGLELTSVPFSRGSVNDLDPEFSHNSEASLSPLPDLSTDDLDVVGRKACEDAWAKLGGLPGKGMSQVVIYYGTPYASVVRPGDSTRSFTDEYRSDVLVDVTLSPDEPLSTASSSSSHTRTRFRYVLRRDTHTSTSISQSSRYCTSQSTNLSLVSNTACSSSASGTEY